MTQRYKSLDEMVWQIEGQSGIACRKILKENLELFKKVQGSSHNHQDWIGGYYDHVTETMNIASLLYGQMNQVRPLPFSLSDALLVMFLHDLEKPWKYRLDENGESEYVPEISTKEQMREFRDRKMEEYGVELTPEQKNGLNYVEGESQDYSNKSRAMNPLAAFCHMCDFASARIWFDFPKPENDSWNNAERIAENR